MSEWKELDVCNLPPDILKNGEYEFKICGIAMDMKPFDVIRYAIDKCDVSYRRKQKPMPTHEDIMTKWWRESGAKSWARVQEYDERTGLYFIHIGCLGWQKAGYFQHMISADIPPEE